MFYNATPKENPQIKIYNHNTDELESSNVGNVFRLDAFWVTGLGETIDCLIIGDTGSCSLFKDQLLRELKMYNIYLNQWYDMRCMIYDIIIDIYI